MKGKWINKINLTLIVGVLGGFLICTMAGAAQETYTLRVSTPYPPPEQALASTHLVAWEEMVTQRTGGAVRFQNFFGGALGKFEYFADFVDVYRDDG